MIFYPTHHLFRDLIVAKQPVIPQALAKDIRNYANPLINMGWQKSAQPSSAVTSKITINKILVRDL